MKALTVVNCFSQEKMMPISEEKAPANSVPAAAVRQKVRVFSGIIGRKVDVGGKFHLCIVKPEFN